MALVFIETITRYRKEYKVYLDDEAENSQKFVLCTSRNDRAIARDYSIKGLRSFLANKRKHVGLYLPYQDSVGLELSVQFNAEKEFTENWDEEDSNSYLEGGKRVYVNLYVISPEDQETYRWNDKEWKHYEYHWKPNGKIVNKFTTPEELTKFIECLTKNLEELLDKPTPRVTKQELITQAEQQTIHACNTTPAAADSVLQPF